MQDITASMFPQMYADLGIDTGDLGCIMMQVDPLPVDGIIDAEDLYTPEDAQHPMALVGTESPHTTLLYGLMSSGPAMKKHVDTVLEGWTLDEVEISSVDYFDQVDDDTGAEYYCLIAKLVVTPALLEGNARLKLLPHLDTFPMAYIPHITIAYINKVDDLKRDQYIGQLNERLALERVQSVGIDYGT